MQQRIDPTAADSTGYPERREDPVEGVRAMMRKIERDIATYYAAHPERIQKPAKLGAAAV